jgi:hypothetical protein
VSRIRSCTDDVDIPPLYDVSISLQRKANVMLTGSEVGVRETRSIQERVEIALLCDGLQAVGIRKICSVLK